ncbi:ATP-binding protein [uncultured Adlercreutzia sp.]|uniref:ATP-binding protein n=1 Tax=uncultured Adlercreutzia sp. TaxID=875803 RepID=UPI0025D69ED2|nr:ATP-binding protein [uncultured Adlercreutzia sp.]
MTDDSLTDFIDDVCGKSRLRVEADLGDGFVRLRSSEAERRQAAQDIRSSEDIVIELLRNSRDAGARHLFLATQKSGNMRTLVVIDDGVGIPAAQHRRIFEPRVTSKLDTSRMDKWGMHGRGMALYSISVNATAASVRSSFPGQGTALAVETDTASLGEKTDQSTFPTFELTGDKTWAMRGPKNILRTCAEFALEHRDQCSLFVGSPTEMAASLYALGVATLSPVTRAFGAAEGEVPLVKSLALASDPDDFCRRAESLGLALSARSARRILDGAIGPVPSMADRLAEEAFPARSARAGAPRRQRPGKRLHLAADDVAEIRQGVGRLLEPVAERYYLEAVGEADISATSEAIRITVPIRTMG